MGPMVKQKKTDEQSIPTSFLELQENLFILKPIHSKSEYREAMKVASDLASRLDLNKEHNIYPVLCFF